MKNKRKNGHYTSFFEYFNALRSYLENLEWMYKSWQAVNKEICIFSGEHYALEYMDTAREMLKLYYDNDPDERF